MAAVTFVMDNGMQIASLLTYIENQNYSLSVDAHYQNVALAVLHSPLPIQAVARLIMNNSDQIASQLSCLQLHQLLPLC